jgi:hypothetical protein
MTERSSIAALLAALLAACAAPSPINRRADAPRSQATVIGRVELISTSQLERALRQARRRLAVLAPSSPIFRIVVLTPTRIEAFYCTEYDRNRFELYRESLFYQNDAGTGYLVLERTGEEWCVLPGREPKLLDDAHYIVT